jgi:hypothetical protein
MPVGAKAEERKIDKKARHFSTKDVRGLHDAHVDRTRAH